MAHWTLHGLIPKGTQRSTTAPPHDLLPCDEMIALISQSNPEFNPADPDEVAALALTHHAILQDYCGCTDVVPLPFGSFFSRPSAIAAQVRDHQPALQANLQNLSGKSAVILRLIARKETGLARTASNGTDFLRQARLQRDRRAGRQAECKALITQIMSVLLHQADQVLPPVRHRPERLLDLTLLICAPKLLHLRAEVELLARGADRLDLDLALIGPMPPYGFVSLGSVASHAA